MLISLKERNKHSNEKKKSGNPSQITAVSGRRRDSSDLVAAFRLDHVLVPLLIWAAGCVCAAGVEGAAWVYRRLTKDGAKKRAVLWKREVGL